MPGSKSFLVLFFKKEHFLFPLPFPSRPQAAITAAASARE
jgi:hypothetical protein